MTDSETLNKEIRAQFKIVCRKCGSENTVVDLEEGCSLSEHTWESGKFSMGCNDCKQNDYCEYL